MNKTLLIIMAATSLKSCQPCTAGIVADTLFQECRGESLSGQVAVASVIWNRSNRTPESLKAVCLARRQFSCWNQGYVKPVPRNAQERAILAVLEGIERQMESGTFKPSVRATQYYAEKPPYWAKDFQVEKVIGGHTFMVKKGKQ